MEANLSFEQGSFRDQPDREHLFHEGFFHASALQAWREYVVDPLFSGDPILPFADRTEWADSTHEEKYQADVSTSPIHGSSNA